MMWDYNGWWQYGMGYGFHWVFMLAFWGLLIWAAVSLYRGAARRTVAVTENSRQRALGILQERFARGELTREEIQAMRKELA